MSPTAVILNPLESRTTSAVSEVLSLALGAGFTLVLFLAVALFQATETPAPDPDITELHAMAMPLDTPPPRPLEKEPVAVAAVPFAGLEIAASDSPVRIAVVPTDLSQLLPISTTAPAAKIEPARLYTEFKPKTEIGGDFSRIFQQHEVDQRPQVVSRPKPYIPPVVRGTAESLRISVLLLIDTRGAVASLRVLQGSGNKYFDDIIIHDIRNLWIFSPAMKRGHKVRCLVQQNVRVVWEGGFPFDS